MKTNIEEIKADVLVIGGGATGCWAAIATSKHDLDVVLINKFTFGKSGTTIVGMVSYSAVMGEMGICPEDTPDCYFEDLVREGAGIGEQNLIEALVRRSRETVLQLEKMGVKCNTVHLITTILILTCLTAKLFWFLDFTGQPLIFRLTTLGLR